MYLKIEMFSVDSSHEIFNILIFDLMRMISSNLDSCSQLVLRKGWVAIFY